MPNQRQLQIAYLRLCRLVIHVLLDVPSEQQYLAAIADDVVALPDWVVPVCLEVRAGVGVTDLALPVNGKVCGANVLRIICAQMFDPAMHQFKRLYEMRMVLA